MDNNDAEKEKRDLEIIREMLLKADKRIREEIEKKYAEADNDQPRKKRFEVPMDKVMEHVRKKKEWSDRFKNLKNDGDKWYEELSPMEAAESFQYNDEFPDFETYWGLNKQDDENSDSHDTDDESIEDDECNEEYNMELEQGMIVDHRYTLEANLGSGGFGEVWRAKDIVTGLPIAIKLHLKSEKCLAEALLKEFQVTYGLRHKNIVVPTHFGTWNKRPYIIMPLCASSLEDFSDDLISGLEQNGGKFDLRETNAMVWLIINEVAEGLKYLHATDTIHGDIKPSNILNDMFGGIAICDFGFVKFAQSDTNMLRDYTKSVGTKAYMAPESCTDTPTISKKSDIWSLGATIYELITGFPPYQGLGGAALEFDYPDPRINSDIWDEDLNKLINVCLRKDEEERPSAASIANLAHDKLMQYKEYLKNNS